MHFIGLGIHFKPRSGIIQNHVALGGGAAIPYRYGALLESQPRENTGIESCLRGKTPKVPT